MGLAQIALRLLSIPASEASTERLFFKKRHIVAKQRVNSFYGLQVTCLM